MASASSIELSIIPSDEENKDKPSSYDEISSDKSDRGEGQGHESTSSVDSSSSSGYSLGESLSDSEEERRVLDDPMEKIPPDFEWCKRHYEANTVKNIETIDKRMNREDSRYFCQCCGLPLKNSAKDFSLFSTFKSLCQLGTCFAFYFRLKLFTVISLFTWSISCSCLVIYSVHGEDSAQEFSPNEELAYISDWSLGNFGKCGENCTGSYMDKIVIFNFISLFLIILEGIVYRHFQTKKVDELEQKYITPSSFCVMVSNIHKEMADEDIKKWFRGLTKNGEIIYISRCYKIRDQSVREKIIMDLKRKKRALRLEEKEAEERRKETGEVVHREIPFDLEIIKIKEKIFETRYEMEKELDDSEFCKKAFVVFANSVTVSEVSVPFKLNYFQRFWEFIKLKIFMCKRQGKRFWDNHKLHVEKAVGPRDILWENLAVGLKHKSLRQLITYSCTFVCLIVSFGITLGISSIIDVLASQENTSTAEDFFIGILSFLSSIVVTLINIALEKIIRHLSSFERHDSYTKFNLSVSIKLTIATFINTGILPIFQNIETHNWFHTNGLMNAIFYNMISIALVGPFLYAFDFWYIVKRIKMKYQEKKGENCTLTQREAHALFEPPPVDMAQLHSDTMLMMFMVAMYVFILPVVAIIACFGSIVQFCVQRYLILRRHKQPPQLGPELATMFVKLSPFMILIYGVSLFIFHSVLLSQQRTAASLFLIACVLYFFIPVQGIVRRRCKYSHLNARAEYNECKMTFVTDYYKENPHSRRKELKKIEMVQRAKLRQLEEDRDQHEVQRDTEAEQLREKKIKQLEREINGLRRQQMNSFVPQAQSNQGFTPYYHAPRQEYNQPLRNQFTRIPTQNPLPHSQGTYPLNPSRQSTQPPTLHPQTSNVSNPQSQRSYVRPASTQGQLQPQQAYPPFDHQSQESCPIPPSEGPQPNYKAEARNGGSQKREGEEEKEQ
ncbi:unnamed protein product [Moneuplotes crassus]|uniref:CSC1/OSCA1-like cytosolic domain-containing protein n=1 Tax=Euplotes crassus TaxID=5936 RepID=A0AAD1UD80_EUPCR|nr:unnamed protein product [Moneuplotes crassus]